MSTNGNEVQNNIEKTSYNKNLAWLEQRWAEPEPGSLAAFRQPPDDVLAMWNFMLHPRDAIGSAIIADDLDYFKNNYQESIDKKDYWLIIAPFCGAKKITDFLLAESNLTYSSFNILSYVAASPNETWLMDIAEKMAFDGLSMPKGIFLYANDDVIDQVEDIFKQTQPKFAKPKL